MIYLQTNNNPTFGCKLKVNQVRCLITGDEIARLHSLAEDIGNRKTAMRVKIGHGIKTFQNTNKTKMATDCCGYTMEGIVYHKGNLFSEDLSVISNSTNNLPDELRPFSIISDWLNNLRGRLGG